MDISWHDTDFALIGLDYAGTVRANDSGLLLGAEGMLDSDHIVLWDTYIDLIVPSVMTTQSSSSASRASRMAAAAPGGGT